jgi:cysteine-rich repeat protein
MQMRARVGLLSRNIVIKGEGQGEEQSYHFWNAQRPSYSGAAVCGNGLCEVGETSLSCSADCIGPTYEYGAAIQAGSYNEEYVLCDVSMQCQSGFKRKFVGRLELDNVEMRYFGQNNLRPGIAISGMGDAGVNVSVTNIAMNRGYSQAISIVESNKVNIAGNVIYRSILPTLEVLSGNENIISSNLALVAIFWNTHRGAIQGKGVMEEKLMQGMFQDRGIGSNFLGNIAAGSERAGFVGDGVECGDTSSFTANVAHSVLAGYWFNHYTEGRDCVQLNEFTAWKAWEYGVYGEVKHVQVNVVGAKLADNRAGVWFHAIVHASAKVFIKDSLIVGQSSNGNCLSSSPGLHTCTFYMAWCDHLPKYNVGIYMTAFQTGSNHAPRIFPWNDAGGYPSVHGQTVVEDVTFAAFGMPCASGPRASKRDRAIAAHSQTPDHCPQFRTKKIEKINMEDQSVLFFPDPKPSWINQADCIDMDCDGLKQCLVDDDDGSLMGGSGAAAFSRAEKFSEGSFFGSPFKDGPNKAYMESNFVPSWVNAGTPQPEGGWGVHMWYPNVPAVMWSNQLGQPVSMKDTWLRNGFGIERSNCTLMEGWNAWKCGNKYSKLVIENIDADREIRRISPVALSSDGYTNMLNGCMDHGWCSSYTCLKRLMTFWAVVKIGSVQVVHFTGTNPQSMRLHLANAAAHDKIVLKIYYQATMRLQLFKGSTFMEDLNRLDGKTKEQLVRDGKLSPNNADGGYTNQLVDLKNACNLGGTAHDAAVKCTTGHSNAHGANMFNRETRMLEVVIGGHALDEFLEIRSMPVVAVSMGVSVSVENFYKVKDTFLSNLAFTLGINVNRITIVDVVSGNARRRRNLLQASTVVNFELEPDPVFELDVTSLSVLEDVALIRMQVKRSVNILGDCGVSFSVTNQSTDTAVPGVNFVAKSGFLSFATKEEQKEFSVEILSEPGYREQDLYFTVSMLDAQNATLGKAQTAVIYVKNVHFPPPAAPFMTNAGTTKTMMSVGWHPVSWLNPPNANISYNATLEWNLNCRTPDRIPTDFRTVIVPFATSSSVVWGGLSTYDRVQCRIRVRSQGGWSDWSALSSDMYTLPTCGDGSRHGGEQCDDGGTLGGDGCSSTCVVETGFACQTGVNGVDRCSNGCNNGTIEGGEKCDDGNSQKGDGCDDKCEVETGWRCDRYPHPTVSGANQSACSVKFGDGFRVASREECDDGNVNSNDGCSNLMKIETGFSCSEDATGKSVCQKCGNGILEGSEVCDDSASSGACVSCAKVKAGWSCTAPSCVVGPAIVTKPMLFAPQDSSLQMRWPTPEEFGLPIVRYEVGWLNSSWNDWSLASSAHVPAAPNTIQNTYTIQNLSSSTSYKARVRGCNTEGCTASFSIESDTVTTLAKIVQLEAIGEKVGSAAAAAASGANLSVVNGSIGVSKPPPPPVAPPPSAAVNETRIAELQAAQARSAEQTQLATLVAASSIFGVGFSAEAMSGTQQVPESHGKLELGVQLVRNSDGSTSHEGSGTVVIAEWGLVTSNVEAGAGKDVLQASGVVLFQRGEVNKTLRIDIVDNNALNHGKSDKQMAVTLLKATGGPTILASRKQVTVTIKDNEAAPEVWIPATPARVLVPAGGAANVTIHRRGWMLGALKLKFSLEAISAKSAEDFTPVLEARFAARQATTSVLFPTLNAGRKQTVEFRVVLAAVESECVAGEGTFTCSGTVLSDKVVVGISPVALLVALPVSAVCGDGKRDAGETCDDGNVNGEDGCSSTCEVEAGFLCEPSIDASPGGTSGMDVCSPPASPPSGEVFIRASAMLVGVTPDTFVGQARRIFRQAIADNTSPKVSVDKVIITSVKAAQQQRRASTSLVEVAFQIQAPAADKDSIAQAIYTAGNDGSLTASLKAGGLQASVSSLSTPEFISDTGVKGSIPVEAPSTSTDLIPIILIAASVGLLVLVTVGIILYWRRARSRSRQKVHMENPPSMQRAAEGPLLQTSTEDPSRPQFADAPESLEQDPQALLLEMRATLSPLYGHIVDELHRVSEAEGLFLSQERMVQAVHAAYVGAAEQGQALGGEVKRVHENDVRRLLAWHTEHIGGAVRGNKILSRSFCELLAPSLLARRAYQLFCTLQHTSGKGACVAEMQHALTLGRISAEHSRQITNSPELKYPSQAPEATRPRQLFSNMHATLEGIALAQGRFVLERDLQAATDALASAQSFRLSSLTGTVDSGFRSMLSTRLPPILQGDTGAAGTPDFKGGAGVLKDGSGLFMSKFQASDAGSAPVQEADQTQQLLRVRYLEEQAAARGSTAASTLLPPIPRPVAARPPNAPAPDRMSEDTLESPRKVLPGATQEVAVTPRRGTMKKTMSVAERQRLIDEHEDLRLKESVAQQMSKLRCECTTHTRARTHTHTHTCTASYVICHV